MNLPLQEDMRSAEPQPALRDYPSLLFVETTSRCNLNCAMCPKQSAAAEADEGDFSAELFRRLEPTFPRLQGLVLNGIGEPLLHPQLANFVARARRLMLDSSWIGFQTNGLLLDASRAQQLVDAGVDRICISLDAATPGRFSAIRRGATLSGVERGFAHLVQAQRSASHARLRIGVEFVVQRDNLEELPLALEWAAKHGACFVLVSHLLPYDAKHGSARAYQDCSEEALALLRRQQNKARRLGIDLSRYSRVRWKYPQGATEKAIIDLVEELRAGAAAAGVTLDLRKLLSFEHESSIAELEEIFQRARDAARRFGLELKLPAVAPRQSHCCEFIEKGSMFVSWRGTIHPCYFLWHRSCSHASGWQQWVTPKVFGDLARQNVLDIWNAQAFRQFRRNAGSSEYPYCPGCALAPCNYVDEREFEQDCFANPEPCGSCMWGAGLFQCLS